MKNNKTIRQGLTRLLTASTERRSLTLYQALLLHAFLFVGVLVSILPFFFLITTAFKTYEESTAVPFMWFAQNPTLEAFKEVFQTLPFARMFFNSVTTTLAIAVFQVLFSAMAGFALALLAIPKKQVILLICLAILMIPPQVYLIPQFLLIQKMGLVNTLAAIVLPNAVSAFGIFLFRQAFLTLPYSLYEAATLDGCNPIRIFWSIMLPLVKPTMGSFGVLAALFGWNSLLWPLIVNSNPEKSTLAVGMATLIGDRVVRYPMLMAAASIVLIPMLIVFVILKKYILNNNAYLGNK